MDWRAASTLFVAAGVSALIGFNVARAAEDAPERMEGGGPTMGELFRAYNLVLDEQENIFPITTDKALKAFQHRGRFENFQFTDGGTLQFTSGESDAGYLPWGNAGGRQPEDERVSLWPESFTIELRIQQTGGEPSRWYPYMTVGGEREATRGAWQRSMKVLEPGEVQTLTFTRPRPLHHRGYGPADGIQFRVEGGEGATFEVYDLRFLKKGRQGWFRKEFELPEGEIWRANASVANTLLFVNGAKVEDKTLVLPRPHIGIYATTPVDLKPYLEPGETNCVAIQAWRPGKYAPNVYLQGRVVMADGTMVRLDTDDSWTWRTKPPEQGWAAPGGGKGFDKLTGLRHAEHGEPGLIKYWRIHYKSRSERPASDGLLKLSNPTEPQFFYTEDEPVTVTAEIPEGLDDRTPAVTWRVRRYRFVERDFVSVADEAANATGRQTEFRAQGHGVVCDLDLGRLPRGVYTVQADLILGAETAESHIPEPLVVVGRVPVREVAGDSYEDGLDLELETVVDCTDPDDRPWLEADGEHLAVAGGDIEETPKHEITEPILVDENGLQYRETRPNWGAQFSYKVEFAHPYDWYQVVMVYPDDRERWMGISCTARWRGKTSYARLAPAVITGFRFPVTGRMRELKFLYRPGPGPHAVNVINIQDGSAAAASEIRIYRIANGLPALGGQDAGDRCLGILTENLNENNAFGAFCGIRPASAPDSTRAQARQNAGDVMAQPVAYVCKELAQRLDTATAYAQYSLFTGENLNAMGCWQYWDRNKCLPGVPSVDTARVPIDLREVAARVLSFNGIRTLMSVEFINQSTLMDEPPASRSDAQVQAGADTYYLVDKNGSQVHNLNFLHPAVEATMLRLADEFSGKWAHVPGVLGVNWTTYMGGNFSIPTLWPVERYYPRDTGEEFDYLAASYDDATIARFVEDTGMQVPGAAEDADRFAARHEFLTDPARRAQWIEWRCQKLRAFFLQMRDRMRAHRDDYILLASLYVDAPHPSMWKHTGLPLSDFLRLNAWDPQAYDEDEGLYVTHWSHAATMRYHPTRARAMPYAAAYEMNVNPEYYAVYDSGPRRSQMIMHHWQEVERYPFTMPDRDGWAYPYQSTPQAHARGDCLREPFTQALIGGDPQFILWGFSHVSRIVGSEQPMREFIRVFRALPAERFTADLDTGFETNLAIRSLRQGDARLFYVANPGYWPVQGRVTLAGATQVTDLVSGEAVEAATDEEGRTVASVDLEPFGVAAYRADGAEAEVVDWEVDPVEEEHLTHIRDLAALAQTRLDDMEDAPPMSEDDRVFLRRSALAADGDLELGRYARAWSTVTDWRYWALTHRPYKK